MKMYESHEISRDHFNNKYFEPQDNALISFFLPNDYYAEESDVDRIDYMREFRGTFDGVESTATSKRLIFETDPDEDADGWKSKDRRDWTSNDVLHWIAGVAETQKFPYEFVNANAFNVDGKTLLSFSKKEFVESDEKYGALLYHALHKSLPKFEEISTPFKSDNARAEPKLEILSTSTNVSGGLMSFASTRKAKLAPPCGLVRGPGPDTYSSELADSPESYPFELGSSSRDDGDSAGDARADADGKNSSDASVSSDNDDDAAAAAAVAAAVAVAEQNDFETKKRSKKSGTGKRPPGRPPGVKTKKEKPEKKTGRLWEFIRDLLLDPRHCPSVICWENHDDGVFRFVKSEKVAKIWGDRKGNEKMNYEKLSRAMRYYYRSKVLQPVIGKRLVYKFGPTARGWKTENPNFRH